jgi:serine/threonine protein kinase
MEFVASGSVAELVQDTGPLPWVEAIAIGVKLSGAVETAHRAGILHGDVKPENVLLSLYGEPELADFGVARLLEMTRTLTGRISVSLVHAAPEVLSGAAPSQASDVWALASTVATLIAGKPPFLQEGEATAQPLVARILTAPTPDLRLVGVLSRR